MTNEAPETPTHDEAPTVVELDKQLTGLQRAELHVGAITRKFAAEPLTIIWEEGEHSRPRSYTYEHRPAGWVQPGFRELFGG